MFKSSSLRILLPVLAATCIGLVGVPAWGQEALKIGESYPLDVDSGGWTDVEGVSTGAGRVYEVSHPGATYIAVHFKKFHLAPGDALIVSDPSGGQSYVLEGKGKMDAGRFWSQHVKGDTMVMELVSADQDPEKVFVIDEYVAGFDDFGPVIEQICGPNDFENAMCRSGTPEYDRGRAVARLLIQGMYLCTGWLASGNSHFVTNEHCITNSTEALNTDYEFMAEAPSCGSGNCQLCYPGTIYSGSSFIQDSPGLDYALVQLSGNPASTYGFLEIDNRQAIVGEQVYLVSHPSGRAKEFAYNSTGDVGGVGRVISLTEPTCSGATLEIGYWNDTEGGSSGSPVLAASNHKVIALHHCHNYCASGGSPNRGVPIDLICAEICGFLGCTTNGDCNDGNDCTSDACVSGTCEYTSLPDDTACGGGVCCGGTCTAPTCSNDADCDDADACTTDTCSGAGTCAAACSNDPIQCPPGETCVNGVCEPEVCNNNGTCDPGEDCNNCSNDCISKTKGNPRGHYCCGDGTCEGAEDSSNCAVDCGGPPVCGDGTCDAGEDSCNCAADCGPPDASEVPGSTCADGLDNDCDGLTDGADPDCPCGAKGDACSAGSDCCSGRCKRNGTCR